MHNEGCHMWACITWLCVFKLSRYLFFICLHFSASSPRPSHSTCLSLFRGKQYISAQSIQLQTIALFHSFPRSHRLSPSASFFLFSFSLVLSHLIHSKSILPSFPLLFFFSLCSSLSPWLRKCQVQLFRLMFMYLDDLNTRNSPIKYKSHRLYNIDGRFSKLQTVSGEVQWMEVKKILH